MAAVTNEKKNLNSQTEDVSEFIMLLKQMSDSDRMVIKGMMMWAAGENRPVKTAQKGIGCPRQKCRGVNERKVQHEHKRKD